MSPLKRLAISLFILTSSAAFAAEARHYLIGAGEVGRLKIGDPESKIASVYGKSRITEGAEFESSENHEVEHRHFEVYLTDKDMKANRPALEVKVGDDSLIRGIVVLSERFRTRDGLGPGSTLSDLKLKKVKMRDRLEKKTDERIGNGDSCRSIKDTERKLIFDLDYDGDECRIDKIPGTSKVEKVYVYRP